MSANDPKRTLDTSQSDDEVSARSGPWILVYVGNIGGALNRNRRHGMRHIQKIELFEIKAGPDGVCT
jgi:hypothetical protein